MSDMTLENAPISEARKKRFRIKSRPFAQPPGASSEAETPAEATPEAPTAYHTFSRKLPAVLLGAGGALALIGGRGEWIRETQVASEAMPAEQVGGVMGYSEPAGIVIAILSVVAIVFAFAWIQRQPLLKVLRPAGTKVVSAFITIFLVAMIGWQVPAADDRAAAIAREAREGSLEFLTFHAGLGWGAWCLIAAAVLSALGLVTGLMREIDIKGGIPE